MDNKELIQKLRAERFKFARTYAQKAPHEYIMRDWNPNLYAEVMQYIKDYGYTKMYYNTPFRYADLDGYKYWHHGLITLNREPLKGYTDDEIAKFSIEGYTS